MINSDELTMSQTNPQEVLSHTAEGEEMENTIGLEDIPRKMRKELYSERLWVNRQMKTHCASQRQMLFLSRLQPDLGQHPQRLRQQNPPRLKA